MPLSVIASVSLSDPSDVRYCNLRMNVGWMDLERRSLGFGGVPDIEVWCEDVPPSLLLSVFVRFLNQGP